MITISACMIVKNEEAVLARCLDCLQGLVDEIIIVDTGSTDKTKQIAARYTDKIYDFVWTDDFSEARNASISRATMDYIYIADADEVIDEENRERFRTLKEHLLTAIEVVQMKYSNQLEHNTTYNYDVEYRPKLYKRLREISFTDPIHESVVLTPIIYDSDIIIQHKPTSNHADRDFRTFQKAIRKDGKLSPKLYEMYGKELFIAGKDADFVDAISYYEGMAEKEGLTERERRICQCVLTKAYRLQNDTVKMMKYSMKNLAEGKASSEVCYELGEFYFSQGDYIEAMIWYYNAAYETECELNIRYGGDYSLLGLARCCQQRGEKEEEKIYRKLSTEWLDENMR